jgi:hypothetical protein
MIFSHCDQNNRLELLSAVTRFTEVLLQNNFDYLLGTRDSFDNLSG